MPGAIVTFHTEARIAIPTRAEWNDRSFLILSSQFPISA